MIDEYIVSDDLDHGQIENGEREREGGGRERERSHFCASTP